MTAAAAIPEVTVSHPSIVSLSLYLYLNEMHTGT